MRKIIVTIVFACTGLLCTAQDNWNTDLNDIPPGANFRLGTRNNYPLRFFTNDQEWMTLTEDGRLKINKFIVTQDDLDLGISPIRALFVDQDGVVFSGNIADQVANPQPHSCSSLLNPWYEGGNKNTGTVFNTIGTCDNVNFVLMANSKQLLFLKPNSSTTNPSSTNYAVGVGLNNINPRGIFDVSDGFLNALADTNHTIIHGDQDGTIEAPSTPMTLISDGGLFYRIGQKSGSSLAFSVDGSGHTTMLGATASGMRVNGILGVKNTAGSLVYEFKSDASDVGRITEGTNTFLSFKNAYYLNPQVWVGSRKPSASPYNDFNFAVDGKLVARSIYVIPDNSSGSTLWADYVFANDYKLPELKDVEAFYKENKHLPEIPSTKEVEEKGINIAAMNALLLKKVEELTIYIVAQEKKLERLEQSVETLKLK